MIYNIVRDELRYHSTLLLTVYGVSLPFIILNVFLTNFTNTAAGVLFVMLPVMGIYANREDNSLLKTRRMTLLPVPLYMYAITRHAVWLAFWIPAQGLLLLSSLIGVNNTTEHLSRILLLMHCVIVLIGMFTLFSDFSHISHHPRLQRLYKSISTGFIVLAAPLYFQIIFSQALGGIITRTMSTVQLSVITGILAFAALGLGFISFSFRRSYLTS